MACEAEAVVGRSAPPSRIVDLEPGALLSFKMPDMASAVFDIPSNCRL